MKTVVFITAMLFFLLIPCSAADAQSKKARWDVAALHGTWVQRQDTCQQYLRFVRSDTLVPKVQGFVFREDRSLLHRVPIGCQAPPALRDFETRWQIGSRRKRLILIPMTLMPTKQQRMRIFRLTHNELLFLWE